MCWSGKKPQSDTLYSNFGAGCRMLHVQTWPGKGGVSFRGAQQSAGIENLVVRGFGEYGTGLVLGGDTYSVRDVFLDATIGGEASAARVWSTGLATKERVQGLLVENLTTHNCATGLELSNAVEVKVQKVSRLNSRRFPIRLTYNGDGIDLCELSNPSHREHYAHRTEHGGRAPFW